MKISREWAMPNRWTFQIKPIARLIETYVGDGNGWADPFSGKSTLAQYRNDLNPENEQPSSTEALVFMASVPDNLRGALFDPPYSVTQVSRSYRDIGLSFQGKENPTGGFPGVRDMIQRKVQLDGTVISFGWNTMGMGKKRGFEIIEILIVSHGGNHNDTLCTVEKKVAP